MFAILCVRSVLVLGALGVLSAEVDQLFAQGDLALVRVLLKFSQLSLLPLFLLGFLFLATLFLLGLDFSALPISFLSQFLSLLGSLTLLLAVLFGTASALDHHLLGL